MIEVFNLQFFSSKISTCKTLKKTIRQPIRIFRRIIDTEKWYPVSKEPVKHVIIINILQKQKAFPKFFKDTSKSSSILSWLQKDKICSTMGSGNFSMFLLENYFLLNKT